MNKFILAFLFFIGPISVSCQKSPLPSEWCLVQKVYIGGEFRGRKLYRNDSLVINSDNFVLLENMSYSDTFLLLENQEILILSYEEYIEEGGRYKTIYLTDSTSRYDFENGVITVHSNGIKKVFLYDLIFVDSKKMYLLNIKSRQIEVYYKCNWQSKYDIDDLITRYEEYNYLKGKKVILLSEREMVLISTNSK